MTDNFLKKIEKNITGLGDEDDLYCSLKIVSYEYINKELFFSLEGDIINGDIKRNDAILRNKENEDAYLFFYGLRISCISAVAFIEKSNQQLKCFRDEQDCLNNQVLDSECRLFLEGCNIPLDCENAESVDCFIAFANDKLKCVAYKIKFGYKYSTMADVYFGYNKVFKRKNAGIDFIEAIKWDCNNIKTDGNREEKLNAFYEANGDKNKNVKSFFAYNVGQGNLEKLIFTDGSALLFDIGFTIFENHNNRVFKESKRAIEEFSGDVIISHTDLDHILGAIYADEGLFKNNYWLIPLHDSMTVSAKRLIWYLLKNNNSKTILFDKNDNGLIKEISSNLALYKGKGATINGSGLMVYAKADDSVLLSGDCLYQFWDDDLKGKEVNYLMIPHHGCEVDQKNINNFLNQQNKAKKAVLSVGVNTFGHPNKKHLDTLRSKYKTILWTVNRNNPIKTKL